MFDPVSSVGSSHNRLTSAEDNEEALLFAMPGDRSFSILGLNAEALRLGEVRRFVPACTILVPSRSSSRSDESLVLVRMPDVGFTHGGLDSALSLSEGAQRGPTYGLPTLLLNLPLHQYHRHSWLWAT